MRSQAIRNALVMLVVAPITLNLPAFPAKAATGPLFSEACAKGSGITSIQGWHANFFDYINTSPDGACYIGSMKYSNISATFPGDYNLFGFVSISENQFYIGIQDGFVSDGTQLNYTASLWDTNASAVFTSWSANHGGFGDYQVATSSNPSTDPKCSPLAITSPVTPEVSCDVPQGDDVRSLAMTNLVSVFSDVRNLAGIGNIFQFNATPAAGTSPVNPFLPPSPQASNEPWIFAPVNVLPDQVWWFDPEVTIGYIYNVANPAGPLFDQFTAPDLPFNDTYQLLSSGSNACSTNPADFTTMLATVSQNTPYDFSTPLACFAIKGISEQNALDPLNTLAFVSGLSFNTSGTVTVSQSPISTVAVPGPLPLAGAGVALGWARGLRRRLRSDFAPSSQT